MAEHDDDLESEVDEGAEIETDSYPVTADELEEAAEDPLDENEEDTEVDPSEL
jgi:hypothetical protein